MVDINKIVDVNLDIISGATLIGAYNTVAYVVPNSTKDSTATEEISELFGKRFTSFTEYNNAKTAGGISTIAGVDNGVELFFNNGGEALVLYGLTIPEEEGEQTVQGNFEALVKTIITDCENGSYNVIYIVLSTLFNDMDASDLITMDTYLTSLKAPYSKRLAITVPLHSSSEPSPTLNTLYSSISTTNIACFYTDMTLTAGTRSVTNPLIEEALLLGAFSTQLDLDGTETIRDFCYTEANVSGYVGSTSVTYDDVDSSTYDTLTSNNVNFVSKVGNRTLIFGGNLVNGVGIDTDFGCICVENDIANTLVEVMVQKQYLTALGLTNVLGKIENLLLRYQTNGYVEINSNYTGDSVYRTYNGTRYTIITNGTALPKGYLVTSVPMNNISAQDRQDRRFTPIYVIIQTQKGARVVEVSGSIA